MSTSGPQLTLQTFLNPFELYSDSRNHGYQGSNRNVRLARITPAGGGSIAKSEDGIRCVVTGKESLRILRVSEPSPTNNAEHRSAVGKGGHRIDASRNFWDGSGLKIDSASTDVAWGHGLFNNKILTSARNGELIMWDLNKSGVTKYERRTKDHIRSIHKMSVSQVVHHYCITGSADGHLRVWDLRDMSKSIMRVHHPTSVRSLVFSPSLWQPLQAVVGLDNGSIYRWDLKMGQRGQLDKLPVAHTASVTTLDWCSAGGVSLPGAVSAGVAVQGEATGSGLGWIVSGGLDRCVKVWDLTAPGPNTHIPHKPTYTLHPSFAVRRVAWRPGYVCELAVVSSTEYATSATDIIQPLSPSSPSGLLTRVGSGLGLDTFMKGSSNIESIYSAKEKLNAAIFGEPKTPTIASLPGDAIEIWDVRRSWIAKWSVSGSAAEGGVTDIAFNDSHSIWTEHASGSFSQIDLRDVTRPLDTIPRAAATWEATGSLAFVVDRADRWEVPYDDVKPELRNVAEIRKPMVKALGDLPTKPTTQTTATFAPDISVDDLETFTELARSYIFEGRDRKEICIYNSGVALSAGHEPAAQLWLLLGASIAQYLPSYPTPPASPPPKNSNVQSPYIPSSPQPHPSPKISAYSFPPVSSNKVTNVSTPSLHKVSPGRRSASGSLSRMPSNSTTRRMTPTSSTSSSPRHFPTSLPPITPRRASFFARRDSVDVGVFGRAMLRRPSLSTVPGGHSHSLQTVPMQHGHIGSHSSSPNDKSAPRHVGEGVLDDSSSSSSGGDDEEGDETAGPNSSDEEGGLRSAVSSALAGTATTPTVVARQVIPATPSPLSRVAGRHAWTDEDEDGRKDDIHDEASSSSSSSPSPQSTSDADSDGSSSPAKHSKSVHSNSGKVPRGIRVASGRMVKSRSRSSTVASLAAPPPPRPLVHHDSHSSIRTVTVGEISYMDQVEEGVGGEVDDHVQSRDFRQGHNRQKSQAISELMPNSSGRVPETYESGPDEDDEKSSDESHWTDRRVELIRAEELRFRETTLAALKYALEEFAENGDVQMCAMLSLVASKELGISKMRAMRFLDSYIELLTRLRLHTCAAYLRKYCEIEDLRRSTLLGTTIYTSCGKCRKPLLIPAGSRQANELNRGRYAYCLACKISCVMCSICRLPVRALLFQCSICNHGGHQACYRQYYMQHAMVDLPTSFLPLSNDGRGRTSMRPQTGPLDDDTSSTISMQSSTVDTPATQSPVQTNRLGKLAGHPCAAGCGHLCWAANRDVDDS